MGAPSDFGKVLDRRKADRVFKQKPPIMDQKIQI